jgi:hypothetical protein
LYRAIWRHRAGRIVELGIGTGRRAVRMIQMARRCSPEATVHYTGFDQFESRRAADGPGMNLKLAHRTLSATGAQVRLVPGEPLQVLPAMATRLGRADLIVFSPRLDARQLAAIWPYVPRMLGEDAQVFVGSTLPGGKEIYRPVTHEEIATLAQRRRAA